MKKVSWSAFVHVLWYRICQAVTGLHSHAEEESLSTLLRQASEKLSEIASYLRRKDSFDLREQFRVAASFLTELRAVFEPLKPKLIADVVSQFDFELIRLNVLHQALCMA